MYYRSTAHEFLEKHGVHAIRMEGRRPLRFMVDGKPREFDFADSQLFDLIIAYDGAHAPRVIAPNEVESVLNGNEP